MFGPVKELCGHVHLPPWNVKTFLVGLVVLVVVLVVAENWPPMRLSLLGLHADVPKAVVLIVDFLLGFGVAWLMLRKAGKAEKTEG